MVALYVDMNSIKKRYLLHLNCFYLIKSVYTDRNSDTSLFLDLDVCKCKHIYIQGYPHRMRLQRRHKTSKIDKRK